MCRVPEEVLHEGYFLVSVQDGQGLLTNNVRVPVAPIPEELAPEKPDSDCNCGQIKVYVPEVTADNMLVFTLQEGETEERLEFDIDKTNDWDATDNTMGSNYIWESMK